MEEGFLKIIIKQKHELEERIKALSCIYNLSKALDEKHDSLDKMLLHLVDIIPSGWQYPEMVCVRIVLGQKEYKTKNFIDTQWVQSAPIFIDEKEIGFFGELHPRSIQIFELEHPIMAFELKVDCLSQVF